MHRSRVDAFRHRAAAIMSQHAATNHVYLSLTLLLVVAATGPREAPLPRPCERSEAIQTASEDWIASSQVLLAMTTGLKTHAARQTSSAMDCGRRFAARARR